VSCREEDGFRELACNIENTIRKVIREELKKLSRRDFFSDFLNIVWHNKNKEYVSVF
jgi:hypothetical protein